MDLKVIEGYGKRRLILTLNNGFIYTGFVKKIIGSTIIFIDKFNKVIPIEAECIDLINEKEEEKHDRSYDSRGFEQEEGV